MNGRVKRTLQIVLIVLVIVPILGIVGLNYALTSTPLQECPRASQVDGISQNELHGSIETREIKMSFFKIRLA